MPQTEYIILVSHTKSYLTRNYSSKDVFFRFDQSLPQFQTPHIGGPQQNQGPTSSRWRQIKSHVQVGVLFHSVDVLGPFLPLTVQSPDFHAFCTNKEAVGRAQVVVKWGEIHASLAKVLFFPAKITVHIFILDYW